MSDDLLNKNDADSSSSTKKIEEEAKAKIAAATDLTKDAPKNTDFFRGFFTGRQILPNLNQDRYGTGNVMLISLLNCGIFYLIFRGRKAAQAVTNPSAPGGSSNPGGLRSMIQSAMENARKMSDPLSGKTFKVEHKGTAFKDIIGVPEALKEVKQYVDFLNNPDMFTRLGARLPKGCLLTGSPGTGKTLLAKAVAGEANVAFFTCSGADFIEVYAGSGPKRVRELFDQARAAAPAVIFIDEIDAIGSRGGNNRPGGVSGEENRTINQILAELDGLATTDDPLVVFAATNHPDNLDKAIQREGRFDRKVELPMPDIEAREDLFKHYLKKIVTSKQQAQDTKQEREKQEDQQQKEKNSNNNNNNNQNVSQKDQLVQFKPTTTPLTEAMEAENMKFAKELAGLTPGISPAAISTICNEAALAAAIDGSEHVEPKHLRAAVDDVLVGRKHRSRMTKVASSRVALHEAGHALVAWLLPQQRPVIKLSIIPRGNAGGFTQQLGKEPGDHMTDSSLFTDICVMLGGRGAENTIHADLSTGAQDDLNRATDLAIKEMLALGMSPNSLLAFDFNRFNSGRMYQKHSQDLQKAAETECKILVDEAMATVKTILTKNADKLNKLTDELVEKSELLPADLERILGKRPANAGTWSSDVHPEVKLALERFNKKAFSIIEQENIDRKAAAKLSGEAKAENKKQQKVGNGNGHTTNNSNMTTSSSSKSTGTNSSSNSSTKNKQASSKTTTSSTPKGDAM